MAVGQRDPVVTLYRALLGCAAVGVLILAAGLGEFVYFEPFAQTTGVRAEITGVYAYDRATHETTGSDRSTFSRTDDFAAVVDWGSIAATGIVVQAIWYDGFGNVVGQAGPGRPGDLQGHKVVPAELPQGLPYHLPGQYIFAVERVQGTLPVEVLARRLVEVTRT